MEFTPPYLGTLECEKTLEQLQAERESLQRLGALSLGTVYAQMQAQRTYSKFEKTVDLLQQLAPPIINAFGRRQQ